MGLKPDGDLIAEIRYGGLRHSLATKIKSEWWFRVRLRKGNMIRCDCGGEVMYRPSELKYDDSWGGCSHIVALFKGDVTSDPKVNLLYNGDYRSQPYRDPSTPTHLGRLTKLGERMFHWRWLTLKWKD